MTEFKVGDRVRKVRYAYGETFRDGVATVVSVGARKVKTSDGSEWKANGFAWDAKPERGVGIAQAWRIERIEAATMPVVEETK